MSNPSIVSASINTLRVATGFSVRGCDDAQVHLKKLLSPEHTYSLHIIAYLPTLPEGVSPSVQLTSTLEEIATEAGTLQSRLIQVVYNSPLEEVGPYDLWQFHVIYTLDAAASQPPGVKVVLKNDDPETTRGTVTTAEETHCGN